MRSAWSASRAYRSITSSKVRRMSSIIASRLPGPRAGSPLALTGRGELESRSSPSAWASRRAGSMVSTQVRRPAWAAHSATAAAVEVLPTPPDPQHTTIRADAAGQERQLDRWQPVQPGPELLEQAALPGDLTLAVAGLADQPGQGLAVEPGPRG